MEQLLGYAVVPMDIFKHSEDFLLDRDDEWVVINLRNNSVNTFPNKPEMRDIEDINVQWTIPKLDERAIDIIFSYIRKNPPSLENGHIVALVNEKSENTIVDSTNKDLYLLGYTFDRYVIRTDAGVNVVIYKNYPASLQNKEKIATDINKMLKRQSSNILNKAVSELFDIHKPKKRIV